MKKFEYFWSRGLILKKNFKNLHKEISMYFENHSFYRSTVNFYYLLPIPWFIQNSLAFLFIVVPDISSPGIHNRERVIRG